MLNVPETVKALFKQDGVRKNFRVHFPNNELPDITNDNIVQESVKFTESLCSQDVLKFGLTEASVIEFETVGIGNMYGMTIECGCEIDLSSLSAAEIADIAAGTWDGVYVAVGDSDIGFAYFRVPYGVFRVESCPRDHQAMTHRRVQAYSASPTNLQMSSAEKGKLAAYTLETAYTPDIYKLFLSQFGHNNADFLYGDGFTDGSALNVYVTTGANVYRARSKTLYLKGAPLTGYVYYKKLYTGSAYNDNVDPEKLYAIDYNGYNKSTIIENAVSALKASFPTISDEDLEESGFSSWEDLVNKLFVSNETTVLVVSWRTRQRIIQMLYPQFVYCMPTDNDYAIFSITEEDKAVYPIIGNDMVEASTSKTGAFFLVPYKFVIHTTSRDPYEETLENDLIIRQYVEPSGLPSFPASFQPTLQSGNYSSYVNSYSLTQIMNGMLEIRAMFGKVNRNGLLEITRLSKASPESIIPGQYSGFWWDEYDVNPIGSVMFSYNENGEENVTEYTFGGGSSVYDMTGNEVLKAITATDMSTVTDILDTYFIPYLSPIEFTPIDLEMKGLPYIEAGDYLAVTAEDGMIANSFNMKQDISGIQVLTASIESTSGDIIDS